MLDFVGDLSFSTTYLDMEEFCSLIGDKSLFSLSGTGEYFVCISFLGSSRNPTFEVFRTASKLFTRSFVLRVKSSSAWATLCLQAISFSGLGL